MFNAYFFDNLYYMTLGLRLLGVTIYINKNWYPFPRVGISTFHREVRVGIYIKV